MRYKQGELVSSEGCLCSALELVVSLVIQEGLRVVLLLLFIEMSQLRWFGHLTRMPPRWGVLSMTYQEEALGHMERLGSISGLPVVSFLCVHLFKCLVSGSKWPLLLSLYKSDKNNVQFKLLKTQRYTDQRMVNKLVSNNVFEQVISCILR